MINFLDLTGRILVSSLFIISATDKIFNISGTMEWMESFGVPGILIYPTIVAEIILPIFVIVGYQARISAGLLSMFCVITAFLFHFDFSNQNQFISFLKNFALAGGFLFIVVNGTKDWAVDKEKKICQAINKKTRDFIRGFFKFNNFYFLLKFITN